MRHEADHSPHQKRQHTGSDRDTEAPTQLDRGVNVRDRHRAAEQSTGQDRSPCELRHSVALIDPLQPELFHLFGGVRFAVLNDFIDRRNLESVVARR